MKEVARLAGVSVATVSRVFRDPDKVRTQTRELVCAIARDHGYIYNAAAGDMSSKRSRVIGVLVPMANNALFGNTLLGIQDTAMAEGFSVMQGSTRYDPAMEKKLLDTFLQRRVAGIILTGFHFEQQAVIEKLASDTHLPVVVVWEKPANPHLSYVGFDNRQAAYAATNHLLGLGHRRIGLIIGPYTRVARAAERFEGFRDALREAGLGLGSELVLERPPAMVEGRAAMEALLALDRPPTAVFAASDILAIGAMHGARCRGLDIPRDISIIGFDDTDVAAYMHPPLTTIKVNAYEIGKLAAQVVLDNAAGKSGPRHYCLDTDLVIRASCAAPVAAA